MIFMIICLIFLVIAPTVSAQNTSGDTLIFVWNDSVYAHTLGNNQTVATQRPFIDALPIPHSHHGNVFEYENSPLTDAPIDDYGFYQGIASPDNTKFAFLTIQPDGAGYHVILVENEAQRVLFSGNVTPERGYLVPVGWSDDGALILLERYSLHTLNRLRLWRYTEGDSALSLSDDIAIPELKGNSATLGSDWVFLGFDTVGQLGYLMNLNTRQLTTFLTTFALQDPPASAFETYPLDVVGVVDSADLQTWLNQSASATEAISAQAPFLHWPLPDYARSITCYPDSEWTDLQFAFECQGLTTPRAYQGHEGTDIGGKPNGLEIGTQVYAAARGLVIDRNIGCPSDDITCGDAYGNYVLIEHSLMVNHDIETWFTGYAHLQTVLVERYDYIREIGLPIALSGDTGLGGAHLHFEVRSPSQSTRANWIDPWDTRPSSDGVSLWIGGSERPVASVTAAPPPTLMTCQTIDGNNIRGGPGTEYEVVEKSLSAVDYEVFQIQRLETGGTPGDWYHIRWPESQITGWIWSDLMATCTTPSPQ